MNEVPQIPQDDLMDVIEMTNRMEGYMNAIFKENAKDLAISALMGSSVNCLLAQCKTLDEVMFYRNLYVMILDSSIKHIQIRKPEKGA